MNILMSFPSKHTKVHLIAGTTFKCEVIPSYNYYQTHSHQPNKPADGCQNHISHETFLINPRQRNNLTANHPVPFFLPSAPVKITQRTCWWNEVCKEEFQQLFRCRCPQWSYCRSPGRYYNAYCSMTNTGYIWTQPTWDWETA
ncbi:uncharacterized protein LOC120428748 [Culex pipiens pallens]|uniref:uncharacterized protein LOC120428748 n=1 Tax=Culex pipiens pallens TaxID=42434 RepID=UPI001953118F|nr:uncharacterized protein LOC120428748 [Culex pipiens pallens]